MPRGICRLCQVEKELLRQSHIIPDFMYEGMFDAQHRIRRVRPEDLRQDNPRIDRPANGEYEQGILCSTCDNEIIGQYESFASRVLYSRNELPANIRPECTNYRDVTICRNVNYSRLKLFILTILWRTSISSRQMFAEINLAEHENIIREMILSGNAGDVYEFPILLFTWLHNNSIEHDLILQPTTVGEGNNRRYVMPIGGVVYNVFVSLEPIPDSLHEFILKPDRCSFLRLPEESGMEFILRYNGL